MTRAARREELGRHLLGVVEDMGDAGSALPEISVAELIARAGIGRSTLYLYFEDRSALLAGLGAAALSEMRPAMVAWGRVTEPADLPDVLAVVVDAYLAHRVVVRSLAEAAIYDARAAEQHAALIGVQGDALEQAIRAGQRVGPMRTDIDVARTAAWLVWMVDRGVGRLLAGRGPAARARHLDALVDVVGSVLFGRGAVAG